MENTKNFEDLYPLHWKVWHNLHQSIDLLLKAEKKDGFDLDKTDPRGRTALMLSVTLGHLETTKILLSHGANVNVINRGGWTVVQEAVSTGDPELVELVLRERDRQRYTSRVGGIPELLKRLKNAPDFYVEMKWDFSTWVPFISRMCPNDVYRVYKQGSRVRVDTTLLGFDQNNWQRGSRSFIFSGRENGADLYEIDHDSRAVYVEEMKILSPDEIDAHVHSDEQISLRLTTPLLLTYLDTDKIAFERKAGGFFGWGGDKSETISGYDCKVFGANNVEVITKTRTEHLTEEDKLRAKSNKNALQSLLGMSEIEVTEFAKAAATAAAQSNSENGNDDESALSNEGEVTIAPNFEANNPCRIKPSEYFDESIVDLGPGRDIGRPKEMTRKIQKFHAQLWLSGDDYPLSLQEQVMPIVDLMALSNSHFQKLKDFITCSFPAGFPVKIEIPLFHVLTARITFSNIFGLQDSVDGVTVLREDANPSKDSASSGAPDAEARTTCVVDDSVFDIPQDYSRIGGQSSDQHRRQYEDDDDQFLQYAIRQSMVDVEGGKQRGELVKTDQQKEEVDIWEALQVSRPNLTTAAMVGGAAGTSGDIELEIQRAIELSLSCQKQRNGAPAGTNDSSSNILDSDVGRNCGEDEEDDLSRAIRLSQKEEEENRKKNEEEERLLKEIIELSLQEK